MKNDEMKTVFINRKYFEFLESVNSDFDLQQRINPISGQITKVTVNPKQRQNKVIINKLGYKLYA